MKKLLLLGMMCLMALTMQAQHCAVFEFKAGVGISQSDVDSISAIFITYFRPAGYTMVERTQIDKVIEKQGFQRSRMTQLQMMRVGEKLNVSKIVVGNINVVMGQYDVDARVINVETGIIAAVDSVQFATSAYRTSMQNLATRLASKIAITPGSSVQASTSAASTSRTRREVEVLAGFLKIFPSELGFFQSEPTSVIEQINNQAQHGYNNWRIPTNWELSLMRESHYLGSGKYMTRESKQGIVLLVTDGEDYATLQAEKRGREQLRIMEEKFKAARELKAAQERRTAELKAQGLVDLGLPSGTLWRDKNEVGFYTYERAMKKFGDKLPTREQFEELENICSWTMTTSGYKVTGPNGNSIELPAMGFRFCNGEVFPEKSCGAYWSSTPQSISARFGNWAWGLEINLDGFGRWTAGKGVTTLTMCCGYSVRLVQN